MIVRTGIVNIDGKDYFVRLDGNEIGFITEASNINFDPESNRKWVKEHFKVVSIETNKKHNI